MGDPTPAPPVELPPPRRGRRFVWILLLLAAAGIGYFAVEHFRGSRRSGHAARVGPAGGVVINVATAKRGRIGVYLDAIGTVTPVYTASITAQANGIVTAVHYREGQIVKKGDPLIDIDPRFYQAQVLQAQGTLDRDRGVLAQARMNLERYREAWARNGIPRQTLEDQEKLVIQDEGLVKSDEGNLQFAQVQLSYCHITAPINGRVGLRLLDPGNVVAPNQVNQVTGTTSLVVITQIQPITVIFTIAQDDLPEVREQMRHRALPAYGYDRAAQTRIATGTLQALDNQIDTTTGTVKLRAEFANENDALFPNQFLNIRLLVKTLTNVTTVPSEAIQHNGPIAFVYAIENDVALMRVVKTGVTESGRTVVEGVAPGTEVATSSFERLQDKTTVSISAKPVATGPGSTTP